MAIKLVSAQIEQLSNNLSPLELFGLTCLFESPLFNTPEVESDDRLQ